MAEVICTIRAERDGDSPAIRHVHDSAFPTQAEGRLVDALRSSGGLEISRVAIVAEQIVGHVAFSRVTLGPRSAGLGLAPLAVLPAFQNRKIGALLVRAGIDAAHQLAAEFVVLLGSPRYYGRFGFLPASRWRLTCAFGGGDSFQALELRPNTLDDGGGFVRYAPEFDVFLGESADE
jgi:putative acetyltransferase